MTRGIGIGTKGEQRVTNLGGSELWSETMAINTKERIASYGSRAVRIDLHVIGRAMDEREKTHVFAKSERIHMYRRVLEGIGRHFKGAR